MDQTLDDWMERMKMNGKTDGQSATIYEQDTV